MSQRIKIKTESGPLSGGNAIQTGVNIHISRTYNKLVGLNHEYPVNGVSFVIICVTHYFTHHNIILFPNLMNAAKR